MTEDLFWLTVTALMTGLLWMPYTVERILRIGLVKALGHSPETGTAGFLQPDETPPQWSVRAQCAHRNALESLSVFAALVLSAHVAGVGEGTVALAAQVFFYARLAHFLVYVAGVPMARTLAFFAGFGAQLVIAYTILTGW